MAENGKIFSTTSDMHDPPAGEMEWPGAEALAHPSGELARSRMRYSYSKLANIYFVHELAHRLGAAGSRVTANAFNPGMMQTGFANVGRAQAAMMKRAMPHRFGDLAKSSDAYARLVVDDALATASAKYYDRSTTAFPSSDLSYATRANSGSKACASAGCNSGTCPVTVRVDSGSFWNCLYR